MMRILHVVATDQRRGSEMFASDLVRSFGEARIPQHVAVLRESGGGVTYEAPTTILQPGPGLPGLRVDLARVQALRRLIGSWAPDVVQVHGGEALKYTVLGGRTRPVVYRRIGSAPPRARTGLPRLAYTALIRRASRVIAVSEATRRETIETFWLAPQDVVMIPGGVDPGRLLAERGRQATRRALGVSSTSPMILSLGALSWEKDPLGHLRATARILTEIPEAVHVLAGDGPLRRELESAVRSFELDGRVMVLGAREDTADLLAASDVMLLASRTEGMPACLIEAGMAGLPVVAYSVGGVPEVVEDGVTGIVVPRGDEEGLSRSILRLVGDGALRRAMGGAAARRCRAAFDIEVVAPRYLEVYGDVMKGAVETSPT